MRLTLTVTSQQKYLPGFEAVKVFDAHGGDLGRGASNTWVLPDPARIISSRHASISCHDGDFYITDASTNGLYLNHSGRPLGRGNSAPLNEGDVITFGDYEIVAGIQHAQPLRPMAEPLNPTAPLSSSLAWQEASLPGSSLVPSIEHVLGNYLPPLTAPTPPPPAATADHVASLNQSFQLPRAIPDDWDLLLDQPTPPKAVVPQTPAPPPPPKVVEPSPPLEPVVIPRPATGASVVSPTPSAPAAPVPVPLAVAQAAAPTILPTSDLWQAFLDGLGITRLDIGERSPQETMHLAGQLMREMTQGMMDVLSARSSLKSEFRMAMTMIRSTQNNPLKFSVNAEEALRVLLRGGGAGYLPPLPAIQEGAADIRAHQIALLAGLRAALAALLRRFDPQTLEEGFKRHTTINTLLPSLRKARCWEVFTERYQDIAQDAEDQFHELLGDEFARAYEEQLQLIREGR